MRDKTLVEQQIRAILDTENDALALSHKLFSPGGLFNQLAKTEAERRRVAQSSLFKAAQQRLSDLQRKEAAAFSKSVQLAQEKLPGDDRLVRIERVSTTPP